MFTKHLLIRTVARMIPCRTMTPIQRFLGTISK